MKTIKLFLTVCLLAAVTTASAQFANSGNAGTPKSPNTGGGLYRDTSPYGHLWVGYTPIKIAPDSGKDRDMAGFSVGYLQGISVSSSLPVFIEIGALASYNFDKEDDDFFTLKASLISATVPVNVAYKLSFDGGKIALTPYIGLKGRVNISGTNKFLYDDDYYDDEKVNWFKKDDMGEGVCKRFQAGWQIGIGFSFNKFYLGVGYGSDFSEFSKKTKIHTTTVSIGLNF